MTSIRHLSYLISTGLVGLITAADFLTGFGLYTSFAWFAVATTTAIIISLLTSPPAVTVGAKVSQYFFDIALILGAFILGGTAYSVLVQIPAGTGGAGAGFGVAFGQMFADVVVLFGLLGASVTSLSILSRTGQA
jgi:hypothetical protein